MGLSCTCVEWDGDGVCFIPPSDYSKMPWSSRRKRCKSCGEIINPRDIVGKFYLFRSPQTDIEERIHGEEVYLAPCFLCEDCIDIYFNLDELGFCVSPNGSMKDFLEKYKESYSQREGC